jgi:hypothetical protein
LFNYFLTLSHVERKKTTTTAQEFGTTLTSLLSDTPLPPSTSNPPNKSTTTSTLPTAPTSTSNLTQSSTPTSDQKPKSKKPKPTPNPSQPILSLSSAKPPPSKSTLSIERRAARLVKVEKAEKEDRARVRDVVEGWAPPSELGVGGMEFEKGLRKTAQRGGELSLYSPDRLITDDAFVLYSLTPLDQLLR